MVFDMTSNLAMSRIECPNCGAEYKALLGDEPPDTPLRCIECDALLRPMMGERYVNEIIPTWFK